MAAFRAPESADIMRGRSWHVPQLRQRALALPPKKPNNSPQLPNTDINCCLLRKSKSWHTENLSWSVLDVIGLGVKAYSRLLTALRAGIRDETGLDIAVTAMSKTVFEVGLDIAAAYRGALLPKELHMRPQGATQACSIEKHRAARLTGRSERLQRWDSCGGGTG